MDTQGPAAEHRASADERGVSEPSGFCAVHAEEWMEPFPVDALADECRDVALEFRILRHLTEAAAGEKKLQSTTSKDRYPDIVSSDSHRVPLPGGLYINASLIPSGGVADAFVATQAPLSHTVADFWLMVAYLKVRMMVALCEISPDSKCAEYMPKAGDRPLSFGGGLRVRGLTDEVPVLGSPGVWRCTVEVLYDGSCWCLERFRHVSWPDRCSVQPELVLPLVRQVLERPGGQGGTVLAHCEAGAGRTGCFLGLCLLVADVREQKARWPARVPKISVLRTALEMRRRRPKMIQTTGQYQLLYEGLQAFLVDEGLLCPCGSALAAEHRKRATGNATAGEFRCDSKSTQSSMQSHGSGSTCSL